MNPRIGILAIALAGTVLVGSCKKQDLDLNKAAAATPNTQSLTGKPVVPDIGALLNYKVVTLTSDKNAILTFFSGNISVTDITFNACKLVGSALEMVQYSRGLTSTQYQLYGPVSLGNLNIPIAKYQAIVFGMKLGVVNRGSALTLNGSYNQSDVVVPVNKAKTTQGGNSVPVHIMVDEPVAMSGTFSPLTFIDKQDYHTITLYVDPTSAVYGITPLMLENADRTNGEIIISNQSNTQLYYIILQNLANAIKVQYNTQNPLPSA